MFGLTFCSRSSASVILSTAGIWSLAQARGASRRQGPVPHLHRGDKCTTPSLRHCTTIPPSCLRVPLFTTVHHHSNTMLLRTHCEDEEAEEWLELRWVWTARQCRACLFPLYDLLLALSVYLCWCSHFEVCRLWFGQRFELNSKKKKKKKLALRASFHGHRKYFWFNINDRFQMGSSWLRVKCSIIWECHVVVKCLSLNPMAKDITILALTVLKWSSDGKHLSSHLSIITFLYLSKHRFGYCFIGTRTIYYLKCPNNLLNRKTKAKKKKIYILFEDRALHQFVISRMTLLSLVIWKQ